MILDWSCSSLYWGATLYLLLNNCPLVTTSNTSHCDVPPVPPKQCSLGSYCYHGKCYKNGATFNCICNQGWIFTACNICCPLTCSGHGVCEGKKEPGIRGKLKFTCNCYNNYTGNMCETERCIKKCKNGNCTFEGGKQVCVCKEDFSGEYCEYVNPEYRAAWYKPTVGTFGALSILLVMMGVLMPYVMWRQRALIILRIHYFIKRYKDNYSLPYDAFISCTSDSYDDLDFVREVLCPTMESSMGYSVCYGDRDFGAGSLIDSMCEAVRNSRRTILVLSPDYVDDTWPNFEVQIAQHESLRSAHRIIPIIYREMDTISQPSLRNVVSSLQCLKWPHDGNARQRKVFWKKLRVLMPKARTPGKSLITTTWQSDV